MNNNVPNGSILISFDIGTMNPYKDKKLCLQHLHKQSELTRAMITFM